MGLPERKTRSIRFKPDNEDYAVIGQLNDNGQLETDKMALILTESYSGCGLVVVDGSDFQIGQQHHLKVGDVGPVLSEIVWIKQVDEDLYRLGFKYLKDIR